MSRVEESCFALLDCIENPINLKIFLDSNLEAKGSLYLDDGFSLNNTVFANTTGRQLLTFTFRDN